MHQFNVEGFCVANISAARFNCSPGTISPRRADTGAGNWAPTFAYWNALIAFSRV
jgi:hypothetical protein